MDRNLYINKEQTLITKSGVYLTYLYFILWIPLFIIFGFDLIAKTNPKIHRYNQYNRDFIDIPDNPQIDIPLMLEVSRSFAERTSLLKYNDSNIYPYSSFEYHECSEQEYYKFNKTESMNNELIIYYCMNLNNILDSNYYARGDTRCWLSFVNCTSLYQYNLTDEKCSNKTISHDEPLYFAANYISQHFTDEYDDFIENRAANLNNTSSYNINERFYFNIDFTSVQLNDDKDMLFTNNTIYNFYEQTYVFKQVTDSLGLENHFDIFLKVWDIAIKIERSYQKLPDTLANLYALTDILYVILFLLNILFSTYYFHDYFLPFFFNHLNFESLEQKVNLKLQQKNKNVINNEIKEKANSNVEINNTQSLHKGRLIDYIKLFNIANFLKLKYLYCCFKNERMVKFKCLYKEFKKYLSIENITTFHKLKVTKANSHRHNNIVEKFLVKTDNILKNFDLLTFKKVFYLDSDSTFKTKLGGIFSIIYVILLFIFFYYFGYDFWARANPDISINLTNHNAITNSSELWVLNLPIIIGYSKELENHTQLENLYPFKKGFTEYGLRPCTSVDLKLMNIKMNNSLNYICTNLRDILSNKFNMEESYTELRLQQCNLDDQSCLEMDKSGPYYVEYKFNSTWLNFTKMDGFLQQEYFYYNKTSTFDNLFDKFFSIKQNIFIDDRGLILPDENKYLFTSIRNDLLPTNSKGLTIKLASESNEITTTKRTFKKFPETLANVLAMLSFVNIAMLVSYGFIIDYLYMKYFLKKMFSKINIKDLVKKLRLFVKDIELDQIEFIEEEKVIKDLYDLMNFRNYMVYKIAFRFYKTKNSVRFSVVYNEFLSFLSMENLIDYNNRELVNGLMKTRTGLFS
jgi:hypothetical protein